MRRAKSELVGVMRVDHRSAERYPTQLEVLFVIEDELVRATTLDLSLTGMRLHSEVDLPVDTRLNAHFARPGDAKTQQLVGRVAWCAPSKEIAGLYEAGIAFSALSPETNDALSRLLAELCGHEELDDLPYLDDEDVYTAEFQAPAAPPAAPPEEIQALLARARAAQEQRQLPVAIELLRQAAASDPDSPEINEELATALYLAGEVQEAARLFDWALKHRLMRETK